jgi:hypothetical protein
MRHSPRAPVTINGQVRGPNSARTELVELGHFRCVPSRQMAQHERFVLMDRRLSGVAT